MQQSQVFWRFVQIADSGFPTGGFAHSGGLEAAQAAGRAGSLEELRALSFDLLWNVATTTLPFVASAHTSPDEVWALDRHLDATLTGHVANRASRTQGRAFVSTCAQVFESSELGGLAKRARSLEVPAHLAPLFGAATRALGFSQEEGRALFLFIALRGFISAGVRLGVLGPHEGQRLVSLHATTLENVLSSTARRAPNDAAVVSPILDILGSTHDHLYARLFQS